MAKKKPALYAAKRRLVESDIKAERFTDAWHAARQMWIDEPNDDTLAYLKSVIRTACLNSIDNSRPGDFSKYYDWAASITPGNTPEWSIALAHLQARAGHFTRAKALLEPLNNPTAMTAALGFAADKTILARLGGLLPPEHLPAYEAIIAAFQKYESGNSDAARESLNGVGLQSPYLEWKMLLRGLMAFSANDDARAVENFGRLNPERIPAQLAAPFRYKLDESFRKQLPVETAAALEKKYLGLASSGIAKQLRIIREQSGRGRVLTGAFAALETAVPLIKAQSPGLMARLANFFYHAILEQGQPDDMKRFRKAFGLPRFDPDFYKLQGIVLDRSDQLEGSFFNWVRYSDWLKAPPAGWSQEVSQRVRAKVLMRAADIAKVMRDEPPEEEEDDFFTFFQPPPKKKKPKAAPNAQIDPNPLFLEAMAAAPDWDAPTIEVMGLHREAGDFKKAEHAAKDFLQRDPSSIPVLRELSELYTLNGRAEERLDCNRKILALNPLDEVQIQSTVRALISLARKLVAEKDYDTAEQTLKSLAELHISEKYVIALALRAAIAIKRGRSPEEYQQQLDADPNGTLIAKFLHQAHSVILKYKPAEKKAATAEFAAELKKPQAPLAWMALYLELCEIHHENWKFVGEIALRKKILAAIAASAQPGGESEFEALAMLLRGTKEWATLQKLAAKLGIQYSRNPFFPYLEAVAMIEPESGKLNTQKVIRLLHRSETLIQDDPNGKHANLLPEIQKLWREFSPMRSMFDAFFRPR